MESNRLYKREKLCSRTAIARTFDCGHSIMAYPLRAVYLLGPGRPEAPARFMITIPKKKIHTAVERVVLRRRTREAYRLNRQLLLPALEAAGRSVDVAFIYLAKGDAAPYAVLEEKMRDILTRLAQAAHDD